MQRKPNIKYKPKIRITYSSIALSQTGLALARPLTSFLVFVSKSPLVSDIFLSHQKLCQVEEPRDKQIIKSRTRKYHKRIHLFTMNKKIQSSDLDRLKWLRGRRRLACTWSGNGAGEVENSSRCPPRQVGNDAGDNEEIEMVGEGVEFPEIAAKNFTVNYFLFPFFLTFKKKTFVLFLYKKIICVFGNVSFALKKNGGVCGLVFQVWTPIYSFNYFLF